jgi:hypothetical protein
MRKHAFSIVLAVATLGLALGLTTLRAAPASAPPEVPVPNARYWLQMEGDSGRFVLLDTATGRAWKYNIDRRPSPWMRLPMPPGLEGETPTPVEKPER